MALHSSLVTRTASSSNESDATDILEAAVYSIYDRNSPSHNPKLEDISNKSSRARRLHSRKSTPSLPSSPKTENRPRSESVGRSKSRLHALADNIRDKTNFFYDPTCLEVGATKPKSPSPRKSIRFRSRLQRSPTKIEHSSPIDIPTQDFPVLPRINVSGIALSDAVVAAVANPNLTARPPPFLDIQYPEDANNKVQTRPVENPRDRIVDQHPDSNLPTPMPGTNLPLEDPFSSAVIFEVHGNDSAGCYSSAGETEADWNSIDHNISNQTAHGAKLLEEARDTEVINECTNPTLKGGTEGHLLQLCHASDSQVQDLKPDLYLNGIHGSISEEDTLRQNNTVDDGDSWLTANTRSTLRRTFRLRRGLNKLSRQFVFDGSVSNWDCSSLLCTEDLSTRTNVVETAGESQMRYEGIHPESTESQGMILSPCEEDIDSSLEIKISNNTYKPLKPSGRTEVSLLTQEHGTQHKSCPVYANFETNTWPHTFLPKLGQLKFAALLFFFSSFGLILLLQ